MTLFPVLSSPLLDLANVTNKIITDSCTRRRRFTVEQFCARLEIIDWLASLQPTSTRLKIIYLSFFLFSRFHCFTSIALINFILEIVSIFNPIAIQPAYKAFHATSGFKINGVFSLTILSRNSYAKLIWKAFLFQTKQFNLTLWDLRCNDGSDARWQLSIRMLRLYTACLQCLL